MTKEEIKAERLKRFWTQEYLALKAGIYAVQVCEWETGKTAPSLKSQFKLKKVFDENPVN